MAVYRFPLSFGVGEPALNSRDLPSNVRVMYAGEFVCEARLENEGYICDLPDEYAFKLGSGRLEQIFVYEPPLVADSVDDEVRRELVSILLMGVSRK